MHEQRNLPRRAEESTDGETKRLTKEVLRTKMKYQTGPSNDFIRYEEKDGRHAIIFDIELGDKPTEKEFEDLKDIAFKKARHTTYKLFSVWAGNDPKILEK